MFMHVWMLENCYSKSLIEKGIFDPISIDYD